MGRKMLSELFAIEELARLPGYQRWRHLISIEKRDVIFHQKQEYPLYGLVLGSKDRSLPTFGLFAGVHGLEKVGTQVVVAYLQSIFMQLRWDQDLQRRLENCRLVAMPLINPVGMVSFTRSNGNGVDLMRNAPITAEGKTIWPFSGQRWTNRMMWYRGEEGTEMEREAQVLQQFVEEEVMPADFAQIIDIHSGFGLRDRLWYPFATSRRPFPRAAEALAMKQLFDTSYKYHPYIIEPQANHYIVHGDLWDYYFFRHEEKYQRSKCFLPWTLELGSWAWVKKNPSQLLSSQGPFNPMKEYRYNQVMRKHLLLLDFLFRATHNFRSALTWAKAA